jgi:acyl-CoA synthetase (AMP-forming)/AMP-acid ligase II
MVEADLSAGGGATYFLTSLLDCPDLGPEHLERMSRVTLGGAPIPAAVADRAHRMGISLARAYGSTEHPSMTAGSHDDPPAKRLHTDGRPLPGVEIRLDAEGQIWSRGPDLFVGYNDPALDEEAFDGQGWYATGDIGVVDADGYLTITDRLKDVIIRGGENISAAEVEEILARIPSVAEVAVVAAPDPRLGEHGCAFVRPQPGQQPPDLEEVRRVLAAAGLGRQKWPEELRVVDNFERTPSGKIKKYVLRRMTRG